jgi:DNA-binding XRE family transcriptional regulator
MARETTGMGVREFAEHIGVSPDTLTSAEHDRRKVRPITINAYALASGVDRQWLETGERSADGPHDDGGQGLLPGNPNGTRSRPFVPFPLSAAA